jgi:hypothetical protein
MALEQQSVFLNRYAEFYDEFWFDTPAAAKVALAQESRPPLGRGQFAHQIAYLRRRFRS